MGQKLWGFVVCSHGVWRFSLHACGSGVLHLPELSKTLRLEICVLRTLGNPPTLKFGRHTPLQLVILIASLPFLGPFLGDRHCSRRHALMSGASSSLPSFSTCPPFLSLSNLDTGKTKGPRHSCFSCHVSGFVWSWRFSSSCLPSGPGHAGEALLARDYMTIFTTSTLNAGLLAQEWDREKDCCAFTWSNRCFLVATGGQKPLVRVCSPP